MQHNRLQSLHDGPDSRTNGEPNKRSYKGADAETDVSAFRLPDIFPDYEPHHSDNGTDVLEPLQHWFE
jgi:hypothetical protein